IYNRLKDIPITTKPSGSGSRGKFVELVVAQQGKPYVWGAEGPDSFDCSGLVMWALKQLGITFPHYTGDQWNSVQRITEAELKPGDLIFYGPNANRHVSVYISPGVCFEAKSPAEGIGYGNYRNATDICGYGRIKELTDGTTGVGAAGLNHLKTLLGRGIGNGQCYAATAEYSGYLGGCGLGAGTRYPISHVSGAGSLSAASDIGIAYNWSAVGWKVIQNPQYNQLVPGAIINWARNGRVGSWYADPTYGHTGIIRGVSNGRIQTYEQNTEYGQIVAELDREYYGAGHISSIVIPPK
ncbi:MAG: CHAP domain-containing protein, partial [Enterococcus sp.]